MVLKTKGRRNSHLPLLQQLLVRGERDLEARDARFGARSAGGVLVVPGVGGEVDDDLAAVGGRWVELDPWGDQHELGELARGDDALGCDVEHGEFAIML